MSKTLASIVYRHCTEPTIDTKAFIHPKFAPYWSSTPTPDLHGYERYTVDANGDKIQLTDRNGNPLFDRHNNPIWQQETIYTNAAWVISFKDGKANERIINLEGQIQKPYIRLVHD